MTQLHSRHSTPATISLISGWSSEALLPPSGLFGANGLRTGPDGRIYIAQVSGSTISALDLATGALETISAKGSDIVGPDDVTFDADGNLYATEYYQGRVSVRSPDGSTRVLRDDLPGANGITFHAGRLFVNECRIGGRLLELPLDGAEPRVLLDGLMMPNAMEAGPDGLLYYPLLGTNEIWRVDPQGGEPERVAGDLGGPDAVKFDPHGYVVSTQAATGDVLRIDPRTGERTVLANVGPGLDNLTFVSDRLFVSRFTGEIIEILPDGTTRQTLPAGLNGPLDLTASADGALYLADGAFFYRLVPGSTPETVGMLFSPGYPGYVRGVASPAAGEFRVTTSTGQVTRYRPAEQTSEVLAEGFDQLYGIDVAPDGSCAVAEFGVGRVLAVRTSGVEELATGLDRPLGVAFGPDGTLFVAESGAGRVVAVTGASVDTVVDGLEQPHGLLVQNDQLLVVDVGAKALVGVDLGSKARQTIASNLPVGPPPGVTPKPLVGIAPFSGPEGPFAGITAGPDGALYLSADAEGSVLALRRDAQ
ncbi:SMP-30/gluconolactonase/LRE family protein [Cryptosporangium sp. NPDC048952]|uniref:SMP-30/gluconolactonase/LRE family protein n=1 Tax=Cryptosporangium sp. NPDC048952 TaxID=3363961 RepID=UPI00371E911D